MLVEISFWFFCLQLIFAPGQIQGVDGQLHLQYIGCFKGNGSSQVIDAPFQNNLTIEQCIQICYNDSSPRKTFAGLSNGDICVCSDHFGPQVSETECKSKCVGSNNQYCGGDYAGSNPVYSVYAVCEIGSFGNGCKRQCHCKDQHPCERRTGFCQSGCEDHWDGESCNKSKVDTKDEYIGCYEDNRTATFDKKNPGRKTGENYEKENTIEFCIEICSSYNYTYAGLQYGYDCNCGEQYDKYGYSSGCSFQCPGNRSQKCGGNFANSVYHACPTGFYGRKCANRCNCANGTRCSKTGCQNGRCEPGWKGATCSSRDCLDNNGNCGPYQQCTSIDLGYASVNECRCQDGYMKLGSKCIGIHDQYIGCFRGNISANQYILSNDQLTIDICLTRCHQLKKTYTMLKAGTTCLCVDSLKETMPYRDENCNVPCSGNQHQYCGMKDNMDSGYVVYGVTGGSWCSSNSGCDANKRCKNINLGFIKIKRCRCMTGFEQKDPWGNCTDVDECWDFENTCPNAISCTNTFGSFQCSYCSHGLIVDNGTCIIPSSTNYGSQHATAFIIGGVLGFVAIAIFIILIVFLTLRKRKGRRKEKRNSAYQSKLHAPEGRSVSHETKPAIELFPASDVRTNLEVSSKIRAKEFSDHLKRKKAIIENLEIEFESIPLLDETKSIVVGKKMTTKNRFKNILPYDYNRVVLSNDNDQSDNNDYINASFITGYDKNEKLIATQGPTAETVKNFWKMIYENEACTIVMITNLIENAKKKCECYWPQSENSLEIEDMSIVLKLTEEWPDYVIRHLQLSKNGKTIDIKQWHFTMWPDHGVPSNIKGFLDFRRSVRQSLPSDKYTIIHCSAGVGRTGTFMAINYLLEQAETEGCLDVVACLRCLRDQRPLMVQTLEQYRFIYEALSIEFRVGQTAINVKHFDKIYQSLSTEDQESGKTQLEIQFEVLEEQLCQTSANSYTVWPISENCPAQLKTIIVYVQSWKRKDAYIVSDYPDQESRSYFWTICNDCDIKLLIYIDDEISECFFPTQQGLTSSVGDWSIVCNLATKATYGSCYNISLSHTSESEYSNTVILTTKELKVLHVKHFVSGIPKLQCDVLYSVHNAIKGLASVNEPNSTPIAIVNGAADSLGGLFVAAFNAFDMLTERKEVDVFQIAYGVRKSRSELIASLATYEELHSIISHRVAYTSASPVYGNISDSQTVN